MVLECQLPAGPFQKVVCLCLGQEQKINDRDWEDNTEEDDQEDTAKVQERQLPAGPFQIVVCLCLGQKQKIIYRNQEDKTEDDQEDTAVPWYRNANFPLARLKKLYAFA